MKNILAAAAVAILCTACVSESDNSWYGTKLKAQDNPSSSLNAPVPDRDGDVYPGRNL